MYSRLCTDIIKAAPSAVLLPRRSRHGATSPWPRLISRLGAVSALTQAVSGYDCRSCHYDVAVLWLSLDEVRHTDVKIAESSVWSNL